MAAATLLAGYALAVLLIACYLLAVRSGRRWALLAALIVTLIRLGTVGFMWSVDWGAAADLVIVAVPPLLAAAVLAPLHPQVSPWRRQTAVLAAVLHGYVTFVPQAKPYAVTLAVELAVLAVGAMAAWSWQRLLTGQPSTRYRTLVPILVAVLLVGSGTGYAWSSSRLPGRADMVGRGSIDAGGGPVTASSNGVDISTLTGPRDRAPDRQFTLTARKAPVRLASGETVNAWTFDGVLPGPELRVRQGELLEVTLVNQDIDAGVTLHWHGVDVPNAEDGVAGLTQDAVRPGGRQVYRFVAEQVGTFWYHSHQMADEQVRRGLFGALVIEPRAGTDADADLTVIAHAWPIGEVRVTGLSVAGRTPSTAVVRQAVRPGTRVRLRLVNADNQVREFALDGTPYGLVAIDGTELSGPREVTGQRLSLGGAGRYDVAFTMPDGPVQLTIGADENGAGRGSALLLSPDGTGSVRPAAPGPELDLTGAGTPAKPPFGLNSRFDRRFTVLLGQGFGFYDGKFGLLRTINGAVHPDTPTFVVHKGDLVKMTFINRSISTHPMHLHGHHILVLSKNGKPTTGSPWWADTLNLAPGDRYEVAFRADNPGLWMFHCHHLEHAANGMVTNLAYEGYTTPFEVGDDPGNRPE
jgi:FtsP/CotA-like multicopper oxidase with cupredoxin domain